MKKKFVSIIPYIVGFVIGIYIFNYSIHYSGVGGGTFISGKYGADFYTEIADTTMDIYRATYYVSKGIQFGIQVTGLIVMWYSGTKVFKILISNETNNRIDDNKEA